MKEETAPKIPLSKKMIAYGDCHSMLVVTTAWLGIVSSRLKLAKSEQVGFVLLFSPSVNGL